MTFRAIQGMPPTVPWVGIGDTATTGSITANMALLISVWLPRAQTFSAFRFARQAGPTGQIDLGIYRADFSRLFSTGSIAYPATPPGVSTVPFPVGSIGLAPGIWFLAMAINGAQNFFCEQAAILINSCVFTKAASFPLPSSLVGSSQVGNTNVPGLVIV